MEHNDGHNQPRDGHNEQNNRPDDGHNEHNQPVYHSETFVFTGGPTLFASMQSFMNRIIRGQPPSQVNQAEPQQPEVPPDHPEQWRPPSTSNTSDDADMNPVDGIHEPEIEGTIPPRMPLSNSPGSQNTHPSLPRPNTNDDDLNIPIPPLETMSDGDHPPRNTRPIRPLPRPHHHFHAHTPGGIIDLVTFNIAGPPLPPPPPGTATFTFNLGTDVLAGFEAFFLGASQKEREPDLERAKVLVRGMEIVPEGLVRRLERAGGVPGSQGDTGNAGCAVCWGPLLDEVEPHEPEPIKQQDDEKAKLATEELVDEFRGRIVALPCAHVYHAECLLPWFSRNTTCPTCRFDIDPESLTWTPRPPPHPPTNTEPADAPPHDDPFRETNAAEAARLNAFFTTLLRGPTNQPPRDETAPTDPSLAHTESHVQPPPPPPPQNPGDYPMFGPGPLPPPRHPHMHPFPPFFRMPMPFLVFPSGSPTQPQDPSDAPPAFHIPPPHQHPAFSPIFAHGPGLNQAHANHPPPPPPRRERKKWTPPEPVGRTLRQRVESKERELGLRCDDITCGLAPSDEDPIPVALESGTGTKRIQIRAAYDAHGRACEHSFHPACLVTSARVAGVEDQPDDSEESEIQVGCPVCRSIGSLSHAEWEGGVRASAELS